MNAKRRERLSRIIDTLQACYYELCEIEREEDESYENYRPKESARGRKKLDNIGYLNDANVDLNKVLESLNEIE